MLTDESRRYVLSSSGDETDRTVGATPSIPMSFEWPSEPGSPGRGRVRFALLPAASAIAAPLAARAKAPA